MKHENPTRPPSSGPALIGLATLGWGLSMLLGLMPHEDPVVGAGLAVFGAALLATRPGLPHVPRIHPAVIAGLGFAAIAIVVGFRVIFSSAFDAPKIALLTLGVGLVVAAPFVDRLVRLPVRGRPLVPLGNIVAWTVAAIGTPLAMWGLQAALKGVVGTTPVETYVRVALIPPVTGLLHLLGLDPSVNGQTVTYATPGGALSVDIGAACSGVQAMALFGAVLALYMISERPDGRRLAFWTLIGLAGVYVANLIRLTALLLIGYEWGGDALEQAHAQAGWIFFVGWAILFAWLVRKSTPRGVPPAGVSVPTP